MKAHQLIKGATYGPDALKVICRAFDDAWSEIAPDVTSRPLGVEAARLSLANIVLSLAKEDTSDAAALKNEALLVFRLKRPLAS